MGLWVWLGEILDGAVGVVGGDIGWGSGCGWGRYWMGQWVWLGWILDGAVGVVGGDIGWGSGCG